MPEYQGSTLSLYADFDPYNDWRNGGHRGPMTAAQKKTKAKARKKRKGKR